MLFGFGGIEIRSEFGHEFDSVDISQEYEECMIVILPLTSLILRIARWRDSDMVP